MQAHTKSLQLKPTCPSLLTGEDSPSCVYSLVFPFDLCLFPVFLIGRILALLRAACSFPCLQLHNCIQRSLLGWLGCNCFQQPRVGFLFPSCCLLSPVLSSPSYTTGDSFILLVQTALRMPQNPPFRFASLLPHKWHCCPFPAACSSYSCHAEADPLLCHQGHSSERQNSPLLSRHSAHCPCSCLGPCAQGRAINCTLQA